MDKIEKPPYEKEHKVTSSRILSISTPKKANFKNPLKGKMGVFKEEVQEGV